MTAVLLIPPAAIARRIAWLGAAIAARRPGPDPLLVALLDGAAPFATDLARAIPVPVELCFRRASSYRGTASTGTVHLEPAPACAGRAVILIDDILDTGRTLAAAKAALETAGAASVLTCVLLDKPARRVPGGLPRADLVGFTIPDRFVIGYGLDLDGKFRERPGIWEWRGGRAE
jgi:hypoxanthine phosphoribosyltransferase